MSLLMQALKENIKTENEKFPSCRRACNVMAREEEIWQYVSITVLILKYQKSKALAAMI